MGAVWNLFAHAPNFDGRQRYVLAAIAAAIDRAVAAERERGARIVERINGWAGTREIAAEIRGETQVLRA